MSLKSKQQRLEARAAPRTKTCGLVQHGSPGAAGDVSLVGAIFEVALMEATVHLLDLSDAVGGVEPPAEALAGTRDLLVAVPDPTAVVEVLAGRAPPVDARPAIR